MQKIAKYAETIKKRNYSERKKAKRVASNLKDVLENKEHMNLEEYMG